MKGDTDVRSVPFLHVSKRDTILSAMFENSTLQYMTLWQPTEANVFFVKIIYAVLQFDLPPLRLHSGEAPGRDSNP